MLDSLRVFAKSWPGKLLGACLLVGVAGYGISNVITDLGTNTVARVGNEEINSREFLRAYQGQINQVAQQLGSVPSAQDAVNLGIPTIVLQRLAQDAALDEMANGFGLGVSEQKLSQLLREDPSFQGTLGTFDPGSFNQVLQASGVTEAEYFEGQADAAQREQLVLSLFGDTQLPATASSLINRYASDQRTIEYFVLSTNNIDPVPAPTEEELAAYLADNQAEFRTVETRKVQMLRLSLADLAATKTIAEEAIAAEYERTKESLVQPERRTIEQVVLNAEQDAAFQAGLAAGTPFETLVAEAGLTPTSLGTLTQAQVTDATLASAAFGLAEGAFTLVDGVAGRRAVHVSAIEAGGAPTLEEAREQVANTLALAEARTEIADVQDNIEELRAAFRPLSEIASRFELPLYEADVTAGGAELAVLPDLSPEDTTRVARAIFEAEQGSLTPAIPLAGNNNVWFDLAAIEPARDQTLDEVRDTLTETLTAERVNNAIIAEQAEAVARLENGEALADVAASYNVLPQISTPFTRFPSQGATVDPEVASAAFAGGDDHRGSAVSTTGEFVVFQVTAVTPAEGTLAQAENEGIQSQVVNGIYADFAAALRDEIGLRINTQGLNQALALNTGQ